MNFKLFILILAYLTPNFAEKTKEKSKIDPLDQVQEENANLHIKRSLYNDSLAESDFVVNEIWLDTLPMIDTIFPVNRSKPRSIGGEIEESCKRAKEMVYGTEFTFTAPFEGDHPEPCTILLLGDSSCQPEISCDQFHLDCHAGEYLEISDGVGGKSSFCGHNRPKGSYIATKDRDLYLDYFVRENMPSFRCNVRCYDPNVSRPRMLDLAPPRREVRCECGVKSSTKTKIVGGENAGLNEFPWMVGQVKMGKRQSSCGASIINDRTILTAAHCYKLRNIKAHEVEYLWHAQLMDQGRWEGWRDVPLGEDGSIRAPGWDLPDRTDKDEGTVRLRVREIVFHPLFHLDQQQHDVMILILQEPIDLSLPQSIDNPVPVPVCLTTPNVHENDYEGNNYDWAKPILTGWGKAAENAGGSTRLLQKVNFTVFPYDICAEWNKEKYDPLQDGHLCAGIEEAGQDACQGDSGGPLVLEFAKNKYEQIGVVSGGVGCARFQRPGVYARMTKYAQWVKYESDKRDAIWCSE